MNRPTSASPSKFLYLAAVIITTVLAPNRLHAQCPPNPDPATTHPNGVIEGPVSCFGDQSINSTVGIDDQDRFIVAFERPLPSGKPHIWAQRFDSDGLPNETSAAISALSVGTDFHQIPTVAMSPSSRVRIGWLGSRLFPPTGQEPDTVMLADFDFDLFPPSPIPAPNKGTGQSNPSVGIADDVTSSAAQTWTQFLGDPATAGLLYQAGIGANMQLRGCDPRTNSDGCMILGITRRVGR